MTRMHHAASLETHNLFW